MNFSKQLKKYRELSKFSQETLAEKIYVTRQTISKWENDRSYPDIHNLVALSILFDISLDELVKGDMNTMKNVIANEKMNKNSKGMNLFLFLTLIIGVPSIIILGWWGFIPFIILWVISMYFALRIEQDKKKYDIKTYKEIIAFSEGKTNLDELRTQRNHKQDIIDKVKIVVTFSLISGSLALIVALITIFFIDR